MRDHLLWVSTGGKQGIQLDPFGLRSVASCIRVLRTTRTKSPKSAVVDASWKDLMNEAAKYPELAEAIAAMGGDK
jgi:hypothetical protein